MDPEFNSESTRSLRIPDYECQSSFKVNHYKANFCSKFLSRHFSKHNLFQNLMDPEFNSDATKSLKILDQECQDFFKVNHKANFLNKFLSRHFSKQNFSKTSHFTEIFVKNITIFLFL